MLWTVKAYANDSANYCTFFEWPLYTNDAQTCLGIVSNWWPTQEEESYKYVVTFSGPAVLDDRFRITAHEVTGWGRSKTHLLDMWRDWTQVCFTAYTGIVCLKITGTWRIECRGTSATLVLLNQD